MIKIIRFFSNLNFAISLLLAIAIFSMFGSIIEQDKNLSFYQENYPVESSLFGFFNWKFIIFLQLDHIYQNFWFLTLLIIFGVSLICCTFLQQLPNLKFARNSHFNKTKKNVDFKKQFSIYQLEKFIATIRQENYFVFQKKNTFYLTKGLIGRISPIIVHFSIVLILLGSIVASVTGFKVEQLLAKTEITHLQNLNSVGQLARISQQAIRVNDFWITYRQNGKIKQFYSDLSILNGIGQEIQHKIIYVNKPLLYNNLTIYQTDWTFNGVRILTDDSKIFQLPFINKKELIKNQNYISIIPSKKLNSIFLLQLNSSRGNIFIYELNGNLLSVLDIDENFNLNQHKIIDLITSTGLQIKSDPGIIYIYSGFGILILSTFLSYLSFSEIWIFGLSKNKHLKIEAITSRAKNDLRINLSRLLNIISKPSI